MHVLQRTLPWEEEELRTFKLSEQVEVIFIPLVNEKYSGALFSTPSAFFIYLRSRSTTYEIHS